MSRTLRAFLTVAATLALAVPVSAQQDQSAVAGSDAVTAVTETATQPNLFPVHPLTSVVLAETSPLTAPNQPLAPVVAPSSRNTALMIVGGAALLLGAVIGGDEGTIIMIGGATVGLIGLYQHLR